MAKNGKRSGGDRILESRHLVGLFLGVVLLCGVFFTLGYVMGRTQYGGPVHAAASPTKELSPTANPSKVKQPETPVAAAPPGEWDFYAKKDNNHLEPAAKVAPSVAKVPEGNNSSVPAPVEQEQPVVAGAKPPARFAAPRILKGAIVLQIAALTHESDALAMADALQQKKFPSFVVAPSTDNLYRVQVGPYANDQAADTAKTALDHDGFKAITKR
jgi:DedD protein